MTIAGWTALERYVRELFDAPLAFPRGGKFVGAFAAFSTKMVFQCTAKKGNATDPHAFYFSGFTARFDGYFSHVCFRSLMISRGVCREKVPVEPRSEAIPGKCGCCKRCQSTEISSSDPGGYEVFSRMY